ncbi:MAG: MBL fold metallo-hydrolase [Bacteroidia bacterium]|nr:MBL fold metallo-hydrolase [Bacteroidia bacterium]
MKQVRLLLKTAGYCLAKEHHALKGGRRQNICFPALYALIQHPEQGWILFDTGYTQRFYEATQRFPGILYKWMTPTFIRPEEEAVAEVRRMGINPEDIKHIIVSHFHADHVGGLRDFPRAVFYCTKTAFDQVTQLKGFAGVRRGLLSGHLPEDFSLRATLVDTGKFPARHDPDLGEMTDLFGDGSILLPYLPGHAAGQMGALLNTLEGKVLLAADAFWLRENLEENRLPSPVVKLFFDSWTDFKTSLAKVRKFWQNHPEIKIIPTHCEKTIKEVIGH